MASRSVLRFPFKIDGDNRTPVVVQEIVLGCISVNFYAQFSVSGCIPSRASFELVFVVPSEFLLGRVRVFAENGSSTASVLVLYRRGISG